MNSIVVALGRILISFIISFVITLVAMPKVIPYLHRLKFGQIEREEGPESHKKKNGTPTMGGIVFIVSTVLAIILVNPKNLLDPAVLAVLIAFVGMGLIGFLDDYLIVVKKNNEGLKAGQKYLLQSLVALAFYFFAKTYVPSFSTIVEIPLLNIQLDFGWAYLILVYFMFTATSNGVNLSDGLDGLATGLSMMAIAPFVVYSLMLKNTSISSFGMAAVGGLCGFMFYNFHPAKIFMGDAGSLSLGGLIAALAVITKQELLLIIVGGVFVLETLSVIIQVVSFKLTGKRVFRMAPLHHHFELSGFEEQQVVYGFWFVGFIFGIIGCLIGVI